MAQVSSEELKKERIKQQDKLKQLLITTDQLNWSEGKNDDPLDGLRYIGGVDISYTKTDRSYACAFLVVYEYPSMKPYIASFLAYCEVEHYINCLNKLKEEQPLLMPQVILVDGNGILHPRGFGLACHLGVLADIPTIGVAKNLLQVNGICRDSNHIAQIASLKHKGDTFPLIDESGNVLGMGLKGSEESKRAIYVSIGHRISISAAVKIVVACCKYRVPEPIREADRLSRAYLHSNAKVKH